MGIVQYMSNSAGCQLAIFPLTCNKLAFLSSLDFSQCGLMYRENHATDSPDCQDRSSSNMIVQKTYIPEWHKNTYILENTQ